jgi:hypothetical protein
MSMGVFEQGALSKSWKKCGKKECHAFVEKGGTGPVLENPIVGN